MLTLNHNANGIVMWDYPSDTELEKVTNEFSRALAGEKIVRRTLRTLTVVFEASISKIYVAGWRFGDRMLVSILSLQVPSSSAQVTVSLREGARGMSKVLWGTGEWNLGYSCLVNDGRHALETDLEIIGVCSNNEAMVVVHPSSVEIQWITEIGGA
ncbi:hypothetical protein N7495_005196 [Penicillium taxi]|uniref:uncharacterized protein n=1 Tax=Penicillium taxi TaxID=168475 RepID=UPI00254541DD|nr:uncharacterized protein N7495_005196 [Penicillium taxi]KAJ5893505.1 hypothetical protein N7495_005196 [Penicillium taxi]